MHTPVPSERIVDIMSTLKNIGMQWSGVLTWNLEEHTAIRPDVANSDAPGAKGGAGARGTKAVPELAVDVLIYISIYIYI